MRKFLALLLSVALFSAANAKNYKSVVIEMTDGSTTTINLEMGMVTTFEKKNIVFSVPEGTSVDLAKENVKSMKFSVKADSGIDDVRADGTQSPAISGNMMTVSNLPEGSTVEVFDLEGRRLSGATVSGSWSMSLDDFGSGIFIVRVNGVSYKIKL